MSGIQASDLAWGLRHGAEVWPLLGQHLALTAVTLLVALTFALPVGILVAHHRALDLPVMGTLGILYTIPSLAFFVLFIPFLGLGPRLALVPLIVYAQIALVRNVVIGLRGVDPAIVEAAKGMGMSALQRMLRVELPLAAPVILAGLRVAAVSTIGLATLAAMVNAGGLGQLLFVGVATYHSGKILAGAVAVSALALGINAGLRALERWAEGWTGGP